jgi:hypothetical protein
MQETIKVFETSMVFRHAEYELRRYGSYYKFKPTMNLQGVIECSSLTFQKF